MGLQGFIVINRNKDNIKIQQIQLKTALNRHVFVTVKLWINFYKKKEFKEKNSIYSFKPTEDVKLWSTA